MLRILLVTFLTVFSLEIFAQITEPILVADSTLTVAMAKTRITKPLYYAADQSLFIMPTAYTMPKGTHSFTDYEVVVLQYAYAIGNHTHLSAITLFPIQSEMLEFITLGVKHNYLQTGLLQSSVWASYMPVHHMVSLGNVLSYGSPEASVHFAASLANTFDSDLHTILFMAGGMKDLSPKLALIVEAMSSSQLIDEQSDGVLSAGVRFKGKQTSWDLGAFRPISADMGSLIALPFLKATFIF